MAIVTGVWNVLSRIALPVVAIVALWWATTSCRPLRDAAVGGMITGAIIIGVLVAVIASERQAQRVGRFFDRLLRPLFRRSKRTATMSVDQLVRELRARITDTVRTGWRRDDLRDGRLLRPYYALFVLIMRDVGWRCRWECSSRHTPSVGCSPRSASRPAAGVTESATVIALVGWGAPPAQATAGVVLFSVVTHLMEVPLGGLGWLAWSATAQRRTTSV